MSSIGS